MLSFSESMAESQAVAIERRNRGFQTASVSVCADLKRRHASLLKAETIRHRDLGANARFCEALSGAYKHDMQTILNTYRDKCNFNMTADDWHYLQTEGL